MEMNVDIQQNMMRAKFILTDLSAETVRILRSLIGLWMG